MAMTVAGLVAKGKTVVYGAEVTGGQLSGLRADAPGVGGELGGQRMMANRFPAKRRSSVSSAGRSATASAQPCTTRPLPTWGWIGAMSRCRCRPNRLSRVGEAVLGMRALGLRGANVTVPHKQAVMAHLDRLTPAAQAIGAVNTILLDAEGALVGDNTDAPGFVADLREHGVEVRRPTGAWCWALVDRHGQWPTGWRRRAPARSSWSTVGRPGPWRWSAPCRRSFPHCRLAAGDPGLIAE